MQPRSPKPSGHWLKDISHPRYVDHQRFFPYTESQISVNRMITRVDARYQSKEAEEPREKKEAREGAGD